MQADNRRRFYFFGKREKEIENERCTERVSSHYHQCHRRVQYAMRERVEHTPDTHTHKHAKYQKSTKASGRRHMTKCQRNRRTVKRAKTRCATKKKKRKNLM